MSEWRTLGNKASWQKYPCMVAYSPDYALIAISEEEGMLVDKEGNTVSTGKPLDIGQSNTFLNIVGIANGFRKIEPVRSINAFWKAKYPEYFKGQSELPEK